VEVLIVKHPTLQSYELNEQGIKAYREKFKFILSQENMAIRKLSGTLVGLG